MTLEEVRLAFEATGIGEWVLRDSHWWDDYLNSRPSPKVRLRVFERMDGRGPPYVLQCNVEEGCELTREEIVELVRRLLAAVGVSELRSVESWD